jgi:hypothetical protein
LANAEHITFELKDFFQEDPLRVIFSKRKQDTHFFNAYTDYLQDFVSLRIAWQRIKQGCRDVGDIHALIGEVTESEKRNDEAVSLFGREYGLMTILQTDVRTFIDVARTIMNKLAKLIEKLLGLSLDKGPKVSFTDHKKLLPANHPNIHPAYLDLLKNRTYWYEQDLLLLRDKIFVHGNTFVTTWQVYQYDGIKIIKRSVFEPLDEQHKKVLLEIKMGYPTITITDNAWGMLDEFLRQTRRRNIRLGKDDIVKLENIVSSFGITIDQEFLESIAQHIEDFMREVAVIFAASE